MYKRQDEHGTTDLLKGDAKYLKTERSVRPWSVVEQMMMTAACEMEGG